MAISRRGFLGRAGIGLSAAAACQLGAAPERRPNILWIMTDQQPVSTLGCYGNPLKPTPHLDRLAGGGVRFDSFYVSAFPCSPSRASFLTGQYAHQHGVTTNDVPLDSAIPTLGTICRGAGYDTAYFGKSHLQGHMYRFPEGGGAYAGGAHHGNWKYQRVPDPERFKYEKVPGGVGEDAPQMGFDEWAGGWEDYKAYLREAGLGALVEEHPTLGNHNDLPSAGDHEHAYSLLPEEHHMAAFFRKRAVEFIEGRREGANPFCMAVSFYGPHLPVAPPKPWDTLYSLADIELPPNHEDDLDDKPIGQRRNTRCYRLGEWTEEQYKDYIRRYYGYCAYIDAQIGMILDALDASGEADDTIVVFTADHGDMVGAHGMIYKLLHCGYDELLRVPYIMRYPRRLEAGAATGMLTSSVDALPTLLDYAGLPRPEGVAGRSFAGGVEEDSLRTYAFCDSMEVSFTVTDGRYKFVANVNAASRNELYDLENDPGELTNLEADAGYAETRQRLRGALAGWLRETEHPYAERVIRDMDRPAPKLARLRPAVTQCEYLGGRRFSFGYEWRVESDPDFVETYWSYCQFLNGEYGTDGDIAFRLVRWPHKETPEWTRGDVIPIGPAEIEIPASAGPGEYAVRLGLYEPDKRINPAIAPPFDGIAGTLKVTADQEGSIAGVSFLPAETP